MEGPVVVHHAFLLCAVWIWIYQRYFATSAPRSPEFERFVATRPVLARIAVALGKEAESAERLRAKLGPRAEMIPTLGGFPWTQHVLRVEFEIGPGALELIIVGCRVVRRRERVVTTVTEFLRDALRESPALLLSCWLCPGAFRDIAGELSDEHGWRLLLDAPANRPLEPWCDQGLAVVTGQPLESQYRSETCSAKTLPDADASYA